VLHLAANQSVVLKNVRRPAKSLTLSAEALVDDQSRDREGAVSRPLPHGRGSDGAAVAFVFGPENRAVSEKLVYEAAREAHAKSYTHLYVIGFAIEAKARALVEQCAEVVGVPATCVQATPDLLMGDLLKNLRSSQIFSVCGLPEIQIHHKGTKGTKNYAGGAARPGRVRLGDDGGDARGRQGRAVLAAGHGLSRAVLPRVPGILSADGRLGGPEKGTAGRVR
jgi:hypothetical protein